MSLEKREKSELNMQVVLREESNHGHLGRVSSALSRENDLSVSAFPGLVTGNQRVKEFLADLVIGDALCHIPMGHQASAFRGCDYFFREP
jgi:hypothetical protein